MDKPDSELLEIKECSQSSYHPVIHFGGWRVAFLNDTPKFRLENIREMQRHNTSDEVFVLLNGECTLYIGDGKGNSPGRITAVPLEKGLLYNVRRGVWHTHALTAGAQVVVIENEDVSNDNSDHIPVRLDAAPHGANQTTGNGQAGKGTRMEGAES